MASELQSVQNLFPVVQPASDVAGGQRPEIVVAGFAASVAAASEFAEDTAHSSGQFGTFILGVRKDTAAATAGTDGDLMPPIFDATGRQWVNTELPDAAALGDADANPTAPLVGACLMAWDGAAWVRVRASNTQKDVNGVAIGSIATVWTPTTGKKFRLMGGFISVSAAVSVLLEDNSAGAGNFVFRTPKLLADTPFPFDLGNGKLSAAANNVLKATGSAAANLTGTLDGVEE